MDCSNFFDPISGVYSFPTYKGSILIDLDKVVHIEPIIHIENNYDPHRFNIVYEYAGVHSVIVQDYGEELSPFIKDAYDDLIKCWKNVLTDRKNKSGKELTFEKIIAFKCKKCGLILETYSDHACKE